MNCMNPQVDQFFYLIVLIFSIVIHEVAHGYAALYYGDTTARDHGRLTLNPLKHIDMFGSILLPLILFTTGSPYMVGWAKPVPYNPMNLSNQRKGTRFVAVAGILANLLMVAIFAFIIYFFFGVMTDSMVQLSLLIIWVNLMLATFNLLPVPPLDGSKILASFMSPRMRDLVEYPRGVTIILFLVIAIFLWRYLAPFIYDLYLIISKLAIGA